MKMKKKQKKRTVKSKPRGKTHTKKKHATEKHSSKSKSKTAHRKAPARKPSTRSKHTKQNRIKSFTDSYSTLQSLFLKAHRKAEENDDNLSLKQLSNYKEKISKEIEAYNEGDERISQLLKHVEEGVRLSDSITKKNSPKEDKKEHIKPAPNIVLERNKAHKKPGKEILLEKYDLEVDGAKINVQIKKQNAEVHYEINIPEIDLATNALLNDVRNELISITTIGMKELIDPKAFSVIKRRFMEDSSRLIKKTLPNIGPQTEKLLVGNLIQEMLGLGKIEYLINDPNLEEIVITSAEENIRVYSKRYGWLNSNLRIKREEDIVNYSNIIARRVGRQITILNPLLDAHLVTGDRINAVLYPINTKGNTITIRKFSRDPYTIIDLIKNKTCDEEMAALLWLAIEYEMNVLISGGTASGKTVFLNACMPFIPPNHRIISIEDTRELMLPDFLYWTPLVTRIPNPEGKGAVTMLDLLVNSLRMRPDRIILGEMRKHEEAMVLFEAMHTGHSVYATLHADSAAETVSRLINPPLKIPANLLKAINLSVVMFRDRKKGIRRISQIAEVEAASDTAKANILYRWSAEEDRVIKHSESSRFFEEVNRHTGMSDAIIKKNLEDKKKILAWLVKHNIRRLQDFGKIMDTYYRNQELLARALKKNDPHIILNN